MGLTKISPSETQSSTSLDPALLLKPQDEQPSSSSFLARRLSSGSILLLKQQSLVAQQRTQELFGTTLGTVIAAYFTALVSFADIVFDAIVVVSWFRKRRLGFATALLSTMILSFAIQFGATVLQHARKPFQAQAFEYLIHFMLLSHAVSAFRAYSGKQQTALDLIAPHVFFTCIEGVEIGFEAVPALLIQLLAALSAYGVHAVPIAQIISILLSTLTIAFGVSSLWHHKDVSHENRRLNPAFYGALPSSVARRWAAVSALLMFNMCHVLCKSLGLALLWTTFGGRVAGGFWFGDFLLYCLVKVVAGDFVYWIPTESALVTVLFSALFRLAQKILVDFSAFLHFRHVRPPSPQPQTAIRTQC